MFFFPTRNIQENQISDFFSKAAESYFRKSPERGPLAPK